MCCWESSRTTYDGTLTTYKNVTIDNALASKNITEKRLIQEKYKPDDPSEGVIFNRENALVQ